MVKKRLQHFNKWMDRWTNGQDRTLLNFSMASHGTLAFLKSLDALYKVKNVETLCNLLDKVIHEVGVQNVVQLITNNTAAYVAIGRLVVERHPTISWPPPNAHCLDLLLEGIGKIGGWVKNVVEDAKHVTKFIYDHTWVFF